MANLTPMFASETSAAKALDLTVPQFRDLVLSGHLPKPRRIGEFDRWDMAELQRIISGDNINGMSDVKW